MHSLDFTPFMMQYMCGNLAYKIIKCWEALSIGYLIQRGARLGIGLLSDAKFYDVTLGDYRAILSDLVSKGLLSPATAQKIDVDTNHLLTKGDANPGVPVELFGLYRIWGHPLVKNINGCKKVLNIPHEERNFTIGIFQDRERSMKEMWVTHYNLEHKTWPPCSVIKPPHNSEVYNAYTSSRFPNGSSRSYTLGDWDLVDLQPTMEFDYFPDYTEPLKDRACCHPLELYDYIFATGTTPFHVSDKCKSAALKRVSCQH